MALLILEAGDICEVNSEGHRLKGESVKLIDSVGGIWQVIDSTTETITAHVPTKNLTLLTSCS